MNKKVLCLMSGGLDSSVSAALLKRAGFNVIGVFLRLTDLSSFKKSERRAKRVAKILKIPFLVLDLKKEFKKRIIDSFLEDHRKGLTPNPCVVCNKEIKFGLLLEKTLKLKVSYLVTGHYARLRQGKLLKARDKKRDQSYFLWMLTQKQLRKILFPVGNYTIKEVKNLAKSFGLSFLLKIPKSVEVCFIPKTVEGFLRHYLKPKTGKIVDVEGNILGEHQGLAFYTIGQRRGMRLSGGPYWVMNKNFRKNTLIVTKNKKDLFKKKLNIRSVNWLSGEELRLPLKVKAKIRYRQAFALAMITRKLKTRNYELVFEKSQQAITPGQSAVFYRGSELLGGGIIC